MDKIAKIMRRMEREYPEAQTALESATPFQMLVATILSAQTTDKMVNKITPALFAAYDTPSAFANAPEYEIKRLINSINYCNTKAANIKKISALIEKNHNGRVPDTMEALVKLPGVARKTANVVLSQAFGKSVGIVVDTHVKRVSGRLGLSAETSPEKIEKDLMKLLPRSHWISFPFRLILHGRAVCRAQRPRCNKCIVSDLCPYPGISDMPYSGKTFKQSHVTGIKN